MKNRPDTYIIVSFSLPRPLDAPRIVQSAEPYPNRWTHHAIIQDPQEIDSELMDGLKKPVRSR
jgi:hypothetical protein